MTFNHLVLIGGGHTNVLLMQRWLMHPKLIPNIPITIISRDSYLVYSSMYPSVISGNIKFKSSLIDISSLANTLNITFIKSEVENIEFLQRKIILKDRPTICFSKVILNCGCETKVSSQFQNLVANQVACPIKPFSKSYEFIKNQDKYKFDSELPFVIVGSGLAAIEIAFALRKRWPKRYLILVCNKNRISKKFLKCLELSKIKLVSKIDFCYKSILLCTGNSPAYWIKDNLLVLDNRGRIITENDLRVKNFDNIYAVGDCAYAGLSNRRSSGILAVKASKTLAKNLICDFTNKNLTNWFPQKNGLQLVNYFNQKSNKAFAVYGEIVIGPSRLLWHLKNKLDKNFLRKFNLPSMNSIKEIDKQNLDCRGCAAKVSQNVLNSSLRNVRLDKFVDFPEDSAEIFRNENEVILQSTDGFPAIISDPWLNAKITTLHACSDLWASGVKLSSAQVLMSIPKIDNYHQNYLFSQSLEGIVSTIEELGGEIVGGHTFESRNTVSKPYALGVELALTVQGVMPSNRRTWKKYGMEPGDILMMSRPLGVGVFFAAQMRNINVYESYDHIFQSLITDQQVLLNQIYAIEKQYKDSVVNAATDITGFGFLGHLKEMVEASNLIRNKKGYEEIRVILDLMSFKSYQGIDDLIKKGVKSSLFIENKKIFDSIKNKNYKDKLISFYGDDYSLNHPLNEKIQLLFDPQTCGPILISCNRKYEKSLSDNWYKVGEVFER